LKEKREKHNKRGGKKRYQTKEIQSSNHSTQNKNGGTGSLRVALADKKKTPRGWKSALRNISVSKEIKRLSQERWAQYAARRIDKRIPQEY